MKITFVGSVVTALNGDEYAVGGINYLGPFAFIDEDTREEADHHFWPEMRIAVKRKLWREKRKIGFFCGPRLASWVSRVADLLPRWRSPKPPTTPPGS